MENNIDMQEPMKEQTKVKGNVKLKQVADEMMRKEDRIWTKLNINSGSELYQNKYKQRDYFKLMRNSIDRFFGYYNFTKAEKKELESLFEDMNRHSMNNYIGLKGFYTRKDQIDYINYHTKMPESFLNPVNSQSSMADVGEVKEGDIIRLKKDLPYMASLSNLYNKDLKVDDVTETYFASGLKKFYHITHDGDKYEINEDFVDDKFKMAEGGETEKGFYRLPIDQVELEAYILKQEIQSFYDKLKHGDDVNMQQLKYIDSLLIEIKNRVKNFKSYEEIKGTKYEYADGGFVEKTDEELKSMNDDELFAYLDAKAAYMKQYKRPLSAYKAKNFAANATAVQYQKEGTSKLDENFPSIEKINKQAEQDYKEGLKKIVEKKSMADGGEIKEDEESFSTTSRDLKGVRKRIVKEDDDRKKIEDKWNKMSKEEKESFFKKHKQKYVDFDVQPSYDNIDSTFSKSFSELPNGVKMFLEFNLNKDVMASGGMTAGRWYKDNSGKEFRFIGESDGKLLFNDGEKVVKKSEDDFESDVKETKLFKWFKKGGEVAKKEFDISDNEASEDAYEWIMDNINEDIEIDEETDEQLRESEIDEVVRYFNGELENHRIETKESKNSITLYVIKKMASGGETITIRGINYPSGRDGGLKSGDVFKNIKDGKILTIVDVPANFREYYVKENNKGKTIIYDSRDFWDSIKNGDYVKVLDSKDSMASGGKTSVSPLKDRIIGSKKNKAGSASSKTSAQKIELSDSIIEALSEKAKEYNKKHSNKVSTNALKAVMRRGMGAFSSSHRPGMTRQGWGYARVNKFLLKKGGKKVKATYTQDDDLL